MNILYIASGIPVPGSLGGSTHTLEVARGLAARGHAVHVVACSAEGRLQIPTLLHPNSRTYTNFQLHQIDLPKAASLLALPAIERLTRAIRPDVVIERYYNFAGCGIIAARKLKIPTILEVNALIVDPPEVRKRQIDDRLGNPMRRWAVQQCQWADRIVTPLHTTVPGEITRAKIIELPWGAAVDRFRPVEPSETLVAGQPVTHQPSPSSLHNQPATLVFLGSFRAWHGVLDAIRAGGMLLEQGRNLRIVLIGDGPERAAAEQMAARWPGRFTFTGAIAYEEVPGLLAQATVGIAPFNTAPHPALRAAGFFWSPLKVYEYMAAGLPVVTADIPPLNQVIRNGQEGVLFREGDIESLAAAIGQVLDDPALAQTMGARARERVVAAYSWAQHCAELERLMEELREERSQQASKVA